MLPVTIHKAVLGDVPRMVRLLRELFRIEHDFDFSPKKQHQGLTALIKDAKRSVVAVARLDEEVVGMATAQASISTAEGGWSARIEDVVVLHELRGQGIGAALLRYLEHWAREKNFVRLQLLADMDNGAAAEFYRRRGWTSTNLRCYNRKLCESALIKVS
jgi:GNAT superfamily N-acetyltransferase